jgi:hypothetical protein
VSVSVSDECPVASMKSTSGSSMTSVQVRSTKITAQGRCQDRLRFLDETLASSPRGVTSAAPVMKVHRSLPHNVTSNFRPPSWPGGGCGVGRRGGARVYPGGDLIYDSYDGYDRVQSVSSRTRSPRAHHTVSMDGSALTSAERFRLELFL